MYRATRDFIKAREKHSESTLVVCTNVEKLGTGEPSKCFENSKAFAAEKKAKGENFTCLSGWLIKPYDKLSDSTEIIQHWWNGDAKGNQFDTSPYISDDEEYVLDFQINNFAFTHYERIKSCVAMSMLYKNSKFYLLKNVEEMELEEIKELKTESLFKYL